MNIKQGRLKLMASFLGYSIANAGDMNTIIASQGLRPVISLQGGYASIHADGNTQRFTGTDADMFSYTKPDNGKNTGFIGVFLGIEHDLPLISRPGFFMHTGCEYNYFGPIGINGLNTVGAESQTVTTYNYNYSFQTQQVLGAFKLFATAYERFHPYGEVGFGAAFNDASQYNATTTETESLNLTPRFNNQNKTQFSYNLGLGLDTRVDTKIRVGIGYRYSNFGSSALGNGAVIINNYQSPVSFSPGSTNTYTNQFIAHIRFVA